MLPVDWFVANNQPHYKETKTQKQTNGVQSDVPVQYRFVGKSQTKNRTIARINENTTLALTVQHKAQHTFRITTQKHGPTPSIKSSENRHQSKRRLNELCATDGGQIPSPRVTGHHKICNRVCVLCWSFTPSYIHIIYV